MYDWIKEIPAATSTEMYSDAFELHFAQRGFPVWQGFKTGKLQISLAEFQKKLVEFGAVHLLIPCLQCDTSRFFWENSFAYFYGRQDTCFCWYTTDILLKERLEELSRTFITKDDPEGSISILTPTQNGLQVSALGIGGLPFCSDNYRPEVVENYRKVIADLNSPNPIGRLTILDGPPGTGKTYLIRAMLNEVPKAKFLILPSNMASTLSSPALLDTLSNEAEAQKTIILVIEDADECLSSRATDNVSAISNMLNLSDGIIGNLLDLRIVCTTNVSLNDIDKAVMRPGRLSARVEVGLLDASHAQKVYDRIRTDQSASPQWNKLFYSVAELYAMAKGAVYETNSTNPIGFTK